MQVPLGTFLQSKLKVAFLIYELLALFWEHWCCFSISQWGFPLTPSLSSWACSSLQSQPVNPYHPAFSSSHSPWAPPITSMVTEAGCFFTHKFATIGNMFLWHVFWPHNACSVFASTLLWAETVFASVGPALTLTQISAFFPHLCINARFVLSNTTPTLASLMPLFKRLRFLFSCQEMALSAPS